MEPYYKTTWFEIFTMVYFTASIISAVYCFMKAKKFHLSKLKWTLLGYLIPLISVLFIRRKTKTL